MPLRSPPREKVRERAEWDAWVASEGVTKVEAMRIFTTVVEELYRRKQQGEHPHPHPNSSGDEAAFDDESIKDKKPWTEQTPRDTADCGEVFPGSPREIGWITSEVSPEERRASRRAGSLLEAFEGASKAGRRGGAFVTLPAGQKDGGTIASLALRAAPLFAGPVSTSPEKAEKSPEFSPALPMATVESGGASTTSQQQHGELPSGEASDGVSPTGSAGDQSLVSNRLIQSERSPAPRAANRDARSLMRDRRTDDADGARIGSTAGSLEHSKVRQSDRRWRGGRPGEGPNAAREVTRGRESFRQAAGSADQAVSSAAGASAGSIIRKARTGFTASPMDPTKAGCLYKKREVLPGWRPRTFMLDGKQKLLRYYLPNSARPRGTIPLDGCTAETAFVGAEGRGESGPDGKRLFRIRLVAKYAAPPMSSSQYPGGDGPMGFALGSESEGFRKTYILAGTTPEEAEEWVCAIREASVTRPCFIRTSSERGSYVSDETPVSSAATTGRSTEQTVSGNDSRDSSRNGSRNGSRDEREDGTMVQVSRSPINLQVGRGLAGAGTGTGAATSTDRVEETRDNEAVIGGRGESNAEEEQDEESSVRSSSKLVGSAGMYAGGLGDALSVRSEGDCPEAAATGMAVATTGMTICWLLSFGVGVAVLVIMLMQCVVVPGFRFLVGFPGEVLSGSALSSTLVATVAAAVGVLVGRLGAIEKDQGLNVAGDGRTGVTSEAGAGAGEESVRFSVGFAVDIQSLRAELDRLRRRSGHGGALGTASGQTSVSNGSALSLGASASASASASADADAGAVVGLAQHVPITVLHLVMRAAAGSLCEVVPLPLLPGSNHGELVACSNCCVCEGGEGGQGSSSDEVDRDGAVLCTRRPTRVACTVTRAPSATGRSEGGRCARKSLVVVESAERKPVDEIALEVALAGSGATAGDAAAQSARAWQPGCSSLGSGGTVTTARMMGRHGNAVNVSLPPPTLPLLHLRRRDGSAAALSVDAALTSPRTGRTDASLDMVNSASPGGKHLGHLEAAAAAAAAAALPEVKKSALASKVPLLHSNDISSLARWRALVLGGKQKTSHVDCLVEIRPSAPPAYSATEAGRSSLGNCSQGRGRVRFTDRTVLGPRDDPLADSLGPESYEAEEDEEEEPCLEVAVIPEPDGQDVVCPLRVSVGRVSTLRGVAGRRCLLDGGGGGGGGRLRGSKVDGSSAAGSVVVLQVSVVGAASVGAAKTLEFAEALRRRLLADDETD